VTQTNNIDFETILNFWTLGGNIIQHSSGNVTRHVRVKVSDNILVVNYSKHVCPVKIVSLSVYAWDEIERYTKRQIFHSKEHSVALAKIHEYIT